MNAPLIAEALELARLEEGRWPELQEQTGPLVAEVSTGGGDAGGVATATEGGGESQAEGQQEGGEPQEQGGGIEDSLAPLLERMDGLASRFDQFEEAAYEPEQEHGQQEPQGQQQPDYANELEQLVGEDGYIDPRRYAEHRAEQDNRVMQQMEQKFEQLLDQRVAPIQDEITAGKLDSLMNEFTDLQDPKNRQELTAKMVQFLEPRVQRNPEMAALVTDPGFVKMFHLAEWASKRAGQGGPDPAQEVRLEGGSPASPGQPQEDDRAQKILNAGGGGYPL